MVVTRNQNKAAGNGNSVQRQPPRQDNGQNNEAQGNSGDNAQVLGAMDPQVLQNTNALLMQLLQQQVAGNEGQAIAPSMANLLQMIQARQPETALVAPENVNNAQVSGTAKRKTAPDAANQAQLQEELEIAHAAKKHKEAKEKGQSQTELHIKAGIKKDLWRGIKLAYGERQQRNAALLCLSVLNYSDYKGDSREVKERKNAWVDTYFTVVAREINEHRGYVSTQIRGFFLKYMEANNGDFPSCELLLACLQRNIDLNNPVHAQVFELYWDSLLHKAAGNKHDWPPAHSHYVRITDGAPPNSPNSLYITPSTEAFLVAVIESNEERWKETFRQKQANPGKQIAFFPTWKDNNTVPPTQSADGKIIYVYGDEFLGKYTDPNKGQSKNPGWTKAGRDRLKALIALNKAARAKPETLALEQAFLNTLRAKYNLTCRTKEEEDRNKRRKNKNKQEVVEEESDGEWDEI
jgi:endonuclease/exonuclease/phosphatase family metal-dependent hydrolase